MISVVVSSTSAYSDPDDDDDDDDDDDSILHSVTRLELEPVESNLDLKKKGFFDRHVWRWMNHWARNDPILD